ncbi:MAG: hypothetical protein JSS32_10620 [Verrucomicrobia bacterium]|nr:hypothetical protein [Verrucomicrobiota bacterium]
MKYQNVKAFQKHLESAAPHHLSRVYLIAVPDDFERRRILDSIVSLLLAPDQPVFRLSAAEASLSELFTAIDSPSLFGPEPIGLIDELEKLTKKNGQGLIDLISRPQSSGYLILGSRTKSPFYSAAEKAGVILDLSDEKPWEKEKRFTEHLIDRAKQTGKRLAPDVPALLFERIDKEIALLEKELDKLICFVGEKSTIDKNDVLQISASNRSHTLWQIAEEMVWEGGDPDSIDTSSFHGLIPSLRSQYQMGFKIATLIEANTEYSEIGKRLPKVWPKTLEKRISQAARFGSAHFKKGLDLLFRLDLLSRSGSTDLAALLDFFRASQYVRR